MDQLLVLERLMMNVGFFDILEALVVLKRRGVYISILKIFEACYFRNHFIGVGAF